MTGSQKRAVLICPADRPPARFLAQGAPLVNLSAFGKPLLVWWLEHLAAQGVKQVSVLANDRPDKIRELVGDGRRWDVQMEVIHETSELSVPEARAKYSQDKPAAVTTEPQAVVLLDHFPGLPEHPLFKSYANWFDGLRALMTRAATLNRPGVKEVKTGVWVSAHARVSPQAELRAPCWIGAHTVVGPRTVIGPMAVLEDRVMVESSVEIANSTVAPETFVGRMTELKDSIADGNILINWRSSSCTRVPDAFLMCSLAKRRHATKSGNWFGRLAALIVMLLTAPVALLPLLLARLRGKAALRAQVAVRPYLSTQPGMMETLVYRQLTAGWGWVRDWPQLWSIVKGDFSWVGNRPLSPAQVAELSNDFERLWLAAPIGLISLAHAQGAIGALETRACASMYTAQANWRLDLSIIARALVATTKKSLAALF